MPEPVMTDKDVIDLVRKEFERKLSKVCQDQGIEMDQDVEEEPEDHEDEKEKPEKSRVLSPDVISTGLRIRHKDSGLEYPITSISHTSDTVELRTAEGNYFTVPFQELEQEYELD